MRKTRAAGSVFGRSVKRLAMTFTSISKSSDRPGILGAAAVQSICALRRLPRCVDRLGARDNALVPRLPSEPFARLLRGDEFVLIEPHADVVAAQRDIEAKLALIACGIEAGAHDVDRTRPVLIAEMENLAAHCRVV